MDFSVSKRKRERESALLILNADDDDVGYKVLARGEIKMIIEREQNGTIRLEWDGMGGGEWK